MHIFIGMDTFDLKQFLVENKLTETSRLNEIKVQPKIGSLDDIGGRLIDAGFNFDDGILGGVGSGGGGYYDFISDKINGYDIDEFNEDEFNKWYDSFSLDSFNSSDYDNEAMGDYGIDYNRISQISPGFYSVAKYDGFAQIEDNGDVILYANPMLSNFNGDKYLPIFSLNRIGKIIKLISKEKVAEKLKQNIENPGAWGII
jgi:hypothetical protein